MLSNEALAGNDFEILRANSYGRLSHIIGGDVGVGCVVNFVGSIAVQSFSLNENRGFSSAKFFSLHQFGFEIEIHLLADPKLPCLLDADLPLGDCLAALFI